MFKSVVIRYVKVNYNNNENTTIIQNVSHKTVFYQIIKSRVTFSKHRRRNVNLRTRLKDVDIMETERN